jgi:hypothetical protein
LIGAIRGAGYDAVPDAAAPARGGRRAEHRRALWQLFVASFCATQVMMLATPSCVAGPGEQAPDLRQLLNWGRWLLTFAAGGRVQLGPVDAVARAATDLAGVAGPRRCTRGRVR